MLCPPEGCLPKKDFRPRATKFIIFSIYVILGLVPRIFNPQPRDMRTPAVYMLASKKRGRIYIGVTSDLPGRLFQHQSGQGSKHAATYQIRRLVWFDTFEDMPTAIQKEKSLKRYKREWKIDLIEEVNPNWLPLDPETGEFVSFEYSD